MTAKWDRLTDADGDEQILMFDGTESTSFWFDSVERLIQQIGDDKTLLGYAFYRDDQLLLTIDEEHIEQEVRDALYGIADEERRWRS